MLRNPLRFVIKCADTRLVCALLIAWAFVALQGKRFLNLDSDAVLTDGYASQVIHIMNILDDGGDIFELGALYWIHAIRAAIAIVFAMIEDFGGSPLVGFIFVGLLYPLLKIFTGAPRPLAGLMIPIAMVALSYRAVLVFVSIGYLILFLRFRSRGIYLLLSAIFASLSSATVLVGLMISFFLGFRLRRNSFFLWAYVGTSFVLLAISLQEKYVGFMAGESGYDSPVEGVTGILAVIYRSTIFVSIIAGDYIRASAYVLLLFFSIFGLFYAAVKKKYHGYAVIFAFSLPAYFLEGLGVISILIPILMYMAGISFRCVRMDSSFFVERRNATLNIDIT